MPTPRGRIVRVHDATWNAARTRATNEGRALSAVINEFLEDYGRTVSERRRETIRRG